MARTQTDTTCPAVAVRPSEYEWFGLSAEANGDVALTRPQEMFRCARCGRIAPRYGKSGAAHARKCEVDRG